MYSARRSISLPQCTYTEITQYPAPLTQPQLAWHSTSTSIFTCAAGRALVYIEPLTSPLWLTSYPLPWAHGKMETRCTPTKIACNSQRKHSRRSPTAPPGQSSGEQSTAGLPPRHPCGRGRRPPAAPSGPGDCGGALQASEAESEGRPAGHKQTEKRQPRSRSCSRYLVTDRLQICRVSYAR